MHWVPRPHCVLCVCTFCWQTYMEPAREQSVCTAGRHHFVTHISFSNWDQGPPAKKEFSFAQYLNYDFGDSSTVYFKTHLPTMPTHFQLISQVQRQSSCSQNRNVYSGLPAASTSTERQTVPTRPWRPSLALPAHSHVLGRPGSPKLA